VVKTAAPKKVSTPSIKTPASSLPKTEKPNLVSPVSASKKKVNVQFQPKFGGWLVKDQGGDGFVVAFKDENVYAGPTIDQLSGKIVHKGKSDWRIPTFDEAIYLIDAMPLATLTAGQKEFWTATPKKGRYYVFNLNKSYRLAGPKDSCGLLLVRELSNEIE